MKFTRPLLLTTGALAQTDIPSIIANIQSLTEATTTAIQGYNGDVLGALGINGAATAAVEVVNQGTDIINGQESISQDQGLSLVTPIQDLTTAVNESISALIEKQPIFASNGLTDAVLQSLQSQSEASAAFSQALISKLPGGLQDAGRQQSQPIADAFAAGIAAFGGQAAPSSSSSSAPATATGSASSSTSSSAAVTPTSVYPVPNNTTASASTQASAGPTYTPEPYTGGAALPTAFAGLGAMVVTALVAAL